MLSSDQKKDLMEDIKRPIRYYRIILSGQGGLVVYGKSSEEEYNYWVTNKDQRIVDLKFEEGDENPFQTYMFEKEDTVENHDSILPSSIQRKHSWYEIDEVDHADGSEYRNTYLEIVEVDSDEKDAAELCSIVELKKLDSFLDNHGTCVVDQSDVFKEDYIFYGMCVEEGSFYEGIIITTGRIDLNRVTFYATEFPNGSVIIHTVEYDEEYVDNFGGRSVTKSTADVELLKL